MQKRIGLLLLFFSLSFYGQNDTISVVKHTDIILEPVVDTTNFFHQGLDNFNLISEVKTSNLAVLSADKMNVVYRGLANLISIAVPNCKSFTASGLGLYKYAEGKYQLLPGSGIESNIIVNIVLNDGSTKKEVHTFRILNIPKPLGTINGLSCQECILEMTKEELQTAVISINSNLSIYGLETKDYVDSFQIEFPTKEKINVWSNKLNSKSLEIIKKLPIGSIFIIDYIHLPNPNAVCHSGVPPIKVMIVETKLSNE
ncbi:GldM family protein [Flavobacterium sp. SUN052]|uniref:GldM family protein n=1 Tax=Flavobacterium sp. SUN052 TaxID=3002441 RepID=UPI00237ED42D|nr:GldM family protein [Flavobacterium sp. SUN052]MEC4003543.1 GldM family protein [Flavobacterium sp. SUN052]